MESVLDQETLRALRELEADGATGVIRELMEIFLAHASAQLDCLDLDAAAGDAVSLAAHAHSLKSSSGNVGARGVSVVCQELESLARAGNINAAYPLLIHLREEFRAACQAIAQLPEMR